MKAAVRREGAADRVDRSGRGEESRRAVIDLVRKTPGLNGAEIAAELGIDQSTASNRLNQLARAGSIRREKDGRSKRYYPPEHERAPADPTGCKTEVERKLYEAIKAAGSLAAAEAAVTAGIRGNGTGEVLSGLARRGVLKKVPRDHDEQPQRYEVAG